MFAILERRERKLNKLYIRVIAVKYTKEKPKRNKTKLNMLLEENHEISSIFKDLSDLSACPNCRNMQIQLKQEKSNGNLFMQINIFFFFSLNGKHCKIFNRICLISSPSEVCFFLHIHWYHLTSLHNRLPYRDTGWPFVVPARACPDAAERWYSFRRHSPRYDCNLYSLWVSSPGQQPQRSAAVV